MSDFEMQDGFEDFIDEMTNDEKNNNAVCGLDGSDCEACGS